METNGGMVKGKIHKLAKSNFTGGVERDPLIRGKSGRPWGLKNI
jgi:hypothetical protein